MSVETQALCQQHDGPDEGTKKRQHFPFLKLPPEIRNRIYTRVLKLNHPVQLKYTRNEVMISAVRNHLNTCPHGIHTTVHRPDDDSPKSQYLRTVHYCTNPFTRVTTRIHVEPSVLTLLLVNKQFYREAVKIFYYANEFHFDNVQSFAHAAVGMGLNRSSAIEHVCFRFISNLTTSPLHKVSQVAQNLKQLDLLLDWDSRLVYFNKERTLKSARGMNALVTSIRGLKVLNLVGKDRVYRVAANGGIVSAVVSVDEEDAIGPWLRERMLSEEGKKLFARQQAIKKAQQAQAQAQLDADAENA